MNVVRKCGLCFMVMLAVCMGMFVFSAPKAAHAATSCHASSCKNLDPTLTVGPDGVLCNHDAFLQEQVNLGNGYVQNWFSVNCDANWTVAQAPSGASLEIVDMGVCQGSASGFSCSSTVLWYTDSVPGFGCFSPVYVCNAGIIPSGATHWFTNMVDGSHPVLSEAFFTNGGHAKTHYH